MVDDEPIGALEKALNNYTAVGEAVSNVAKEGGDEHAKEQSGNGEGISGA